jgi:steroid 5-alpha reductase family enzyme
LAVFYAIAGDGAADRKVLIAIMVSLWSLRLGGYLARRVLGHLDQEDGRYRQLRQEWAGNFGAKMFGFFQFQAVVLVMLSVPFALVAQQDAPGWHPLELVAVGLWVVAWLGETLADAQLARFKREPSNRGAVCSTGLWGWSRHPNYFFEWLVWVAYALLAWPTPHGWIGLGAPALMLWFLLRVTGASGDN